MKPEHRVLVAAVVFGLLLSVCVSAVVGAVTYAGVFEDKPLPEHECQCCY